MNFISLLQYSQANLKHDNQNQFNFTSLNVFETGARWMHAHLNKNNAQNNFNLEVNYLAFGLLKYCISLLFFFLSLVYLLPFHFACFPLTILVFYIIEIHFLFLFPLLIDNVEKPILTSVTSVYKIGLFKLLINIIPIGIYMLMGLLNFKAPLKNWLIGCYAILILYQNEIRNRI